MAKWQALNIGMTTASTVAAAAAIVLAPASGAAVSYNGTPGLGSVALTKVLVNGFTAKNLYVKVLTNLSTTDVVFQFSKNAVNGNQIITISSGSTGVFQDTTNTDVVAADDEVCIRVTGGNNSLTYSDAGFISESDDKTITFYQARQSANTTTDNVTRFIGFSSNATITGTEANWQSKIRTAGTFRGLMIGAATNTRTTNTTVRLRINGANGNQNIVVSGGSTGRFQDTSNTDTIAEGDLVNFSVTTLGGGGNFRASKFIVQFENTTNNQFSCFAGRTTVNYSLTSSNTEFPSINFINTAASEATANLLSPSKFIASNAFIYVSLNTLTSSSTLVSRINNTNGTISIAISGGATGIFEDNTNSDTVEIDDTFNWQISSGAGGTALDMEKIGFKVTNIVDVSHSPAVQTFTFSLPSITVDIVGGSVDNTQNPAVQTLTFSLPNEALSISSSYSSAVQTFTFSLPNETLLVSASYAAQVQTITFSLPNENLTISSNYSSAVQNITFSLPSETLTINSNFAASVQNITFNVLAVNVTSGIVFNASVQNLTFSLPNETVSFSSSFAVTTQTITFSLPNETLNISDSFNASVCAFTFNLPQTSFTISDSFNASVCAFTFSVPTATYLANTSYNSSVCAFTFNVNGVSLTITTPGQATFTASLTASNFVPYTKTNTGHPIEGNLTFWYQRTVTTDIATILCKVGSDASNYTQVTLTPETDTDLHFVSLPLNKGVTTGTPNWSAIDYLAFVINAITTGSIKIDDVRITANGSFTMFNLNSSTDFEDARASFKKPTVFIDSMAKALGYVWFIDYEKDINFIENDAVNAPFGLDANALNFDNLVVDIDTSQLKNRQTVKGGLTDSGNTYAQVFEGDNATREWILKNQFVNVTIKLDDNTSTDTTEAGTNTTTINATAHGLVTGDWIINRTRNNAARQITKVTDNQFTVLEVLGQTNGDTFSKFAISKTVGVENLNDEAGYDYMYNFSEKSIRASLQTETLASDSFLLFTYNEKIPVLIQSVDADSIAALQLALGGDGVFDGALIVDDTLTSTQAARDRANAELAEYANPIVKLSFKTNYEGLVSGQLLHVDEPNRGINNYYLIQKVKIDYQQLDFPTYNVQAASSLFGIIEYFQKLSQATSSVALNDDEPINLIVSEAATVTISDVNTFEPSEAAAESQTITVNASETAVKRDITVDPFQWGASASDNRWNLNQWG